MTNNALNEPNESNKSVDQTIFKAYDIRGVYPSQFNESTAYLIGRGYATYLKNNFPETKTVLVGSDMRLSGPTLKAEVVRGLTESGINVDDAGLVSTPTFYFDVAFNGYGGGLQVSASHNPKEYNGVKIVGKNASPVSNTTGIFEIRDYIVNNQLVSLAETKGSVNVKESFLEKEVEEQLKGLSIDKIKSFKVVADAANAMGALDIRAIFSKLNCQLVGMNFDLDGTFPAHEADPMKEENLASLKERLVQEKADLGISSDGDGDRYFFVDEKGQAIDQSIVRGLVAQRILKNNPGAKIGYDVRPGKVTQDMVLAAGGVPVMTPVGHTLIKKQMLEQGIIFAGESSGHYYFKLPYGTFEAPCLLIAEFLLFLSEQDKPLSEVVAEYKKYFHSPEMSVRLNSAEEGHQKLEQAKELFKDGKQNALDGLSVEYPDVWFTIRMSNTEPLIRFAVEGTTKEVVEQKTNEITEFLKK